MTRIAVGRRAVSRSLPVALAVLIALVVAVSGCGGGSDGTNQDAAGKTPEKALTPAGVKITPVTPAPTSSLKKVVWDDPYGEPTSLDPLTAFSPAENTVLPNICDALLRTGPELKPQPGLAESWKQTSPTTVVFKIRKGVRFSDGSPLTMEDVLFSLNRHLDPKAGSFYAYWAETIAGYEQTGPMEVTLTTKEPDAYVWKMLSTGMGTIVKKSAVEKAGKLYGTPSGGVMCTGAFELGSWTPGQQMVLTPNKYYWDTAHKPQVGELEFKFVTDPTTLINGLTSGEIDGSYEVPIQGISQLGSAGKVFYGPNLNMGILQPMQSSGPAANPKIAEALSFAIDRSGIAETVFGGLAVPQLAAVPPDSFTYEQKRFREWYLSVPTPAHSDLEKAKKLVEEAGSPSEVMTIGIQSGDSQSAAVATAIQSTAKEIGLDIEVKILSPAQYQSLVFSKAARQGIDWSTGSANYINVADPLEVLFVWAISDSPFNLNGYDNPKLDALFDKARGDSNPSSRATDLIKALELWTSPPNNIPLYVYPSRLFMNNRVTGAPTGFTTYLYYPWAADLGGS